jgi:hypothetical protein
MIHCTGCQQNKVDEPHSAAPWFMHHAVNTTSVMSIFDKFKLTVICTSLAFFALWFLLKIVTTHGICGWYRIQGWGTKKMYSNKKAISVVCTEYMLLKSNNCNFFFWNNVWNKLEWVLTRDFATEYMKIWTVNGCTKFWIFWTLQCWAFWMNFHHFKILANAPHMLLPCYISQSSKKIVLNMLDCYLNAHPYASRGNALASWPPNQIPGSLASVISFNR